VTLKIATADAAAGPFRGERRCLLVWNARNSGDSVPDSIMAYLRTSGVQPRGEPSYVIAPLRRSQQMDRFGFWLLENASARCGPAGGSLTRR